VQQLDNIYNWQVFKVPGKRHLDFPPGAFLSERQAAIELQAGYRSAGFLLLIG
jgi:hypothetical protein